MTDDLRLKRMRVLGATDAIFGANDTTKNRMDCLNEVIAYAREQIGRLVKNADLAEVEAAKRAIEVR